MQATLVAPDVLSGEKIDDADDIRGDRKKRGIRAASPPRKNRIKRIRDSERFYRECNGVSVGLNEARRFCSPHFTRKRHVGDAVELAREPHVSGPITGRRKNYILLALSR